MDGAEVVGCIKYSGSSCCCLGLQCMGRGVGQPHAGEDAAVILDYIRRCYIQVYISIRL